jgi:DNA invertase Pin-like site-specific DNA recombinase
MRAHVYCRVSQANRSGYTGYCSNINIQIDECVEYCKQRNIEDIVVYEQEQSSRKGSNIPTLRSIMNSMDPGDLMVIHTADRLSRYTLEGLSFLDDLYAKGCSIISVIENITYDEDKMYDRFTFRNIINHAELESDRLSQRINRTVRANRLAKSSAKSKPVSSTRFQCRARSNIAQIRKNSPNNKKSKPNRISRTDLAVISNDAYGISTNSTIADHMEISGVATRAMINRRLNKNRDLIRIRDTQQIDTSALDDLSISQFDQSDVDRIRQNYFLKRALDKYSRA